MAKFFVGQRVRKVRDRDGADRGDRPPKYYVRIGEEGVIEKIGPILTSENSIDDLCVVFQSARCCVMAYMVEPASDGNEKASWDTCVWKPEHMRTSIDEPTNAR